MEERLRPALEHIRKLLKDAVIPPLEGELAEIPELREIHDEIKAVRELLSIFSSTHGNDLADLSKSLLREIEKRAVAMEALRESESRFKYLANHDSLTGAMNRRSFSERAIQELDEALRYNLSCGVIMIDIDHFKVFNDTFGHEAGDEALRHTVRVISCFSRRHDFLGRHGGEEFIFFFSFADKSKSLIIAERIRKALQKTPCQLDSGPVFITASLGVAVAELHRNLKYEDLGDFLKRLIKNADTAMYQAKREGRNRVVLFGTPSLSEASDTVDNIPEKPAAPIARARKADVPIDVEP